MMNEKTTLKERIIDLFKEMNGGKVISVWNEYCREVNKFDDEIMDAYELEEWANNSGDTMNILNRFFFGSDEEREGTSANPNRNYFTFNGYGNIISFDYIYNQFTDEFYYVDADELAEYIAENEEAFYNDEIQEIIDEYTSEEE